MRVICALFILGYCRSLAYSLICQFITLSFSCLSRMPLAYYVACLNWGGKKTFFHPSNDTSLGISKLGNCKTFFMQVSLRRPPSSPQWIECMILFCPPQGIFSPTPLKRKMQKHLFLAEWKVLFAHNAPLQPFHKIHQFLPRISESINRDESLAINFKRFLKFQDHWHLLYFPLT